MSVMYKRSKIEGNKLGTTVNALFDSGASHSFIREDIAKKIGDIIVFEKTRFTTASRDRPIYVNKRAIINFYINGAFFSDEFWVTHEIEDEMIIGAKTLQSYRFKIDFEKEEISFPSTATKLQLI